MCEISIEEIIVNRIRQLGNIGFEEKKGTSRVAYSKAFFEGRNLVKKWMEDAGMSTKIDSIGNLIGTVSGKENESDTIIIGSHIDTVPNGGMYDGVYGVIAAITCIEEMRKNGYRNIHPITVIAFNEEEGNAIGGTLGSKSIMGLPLTKDEIAKLEKYSMSIDNWKNARLEPSKIMCYIEPHIEQGGILEAKKKKIGIVEGIVGIDRYKVRVKGESNHAGSTPMYLRDDALEKSCEVLSSLYELVREKGNNLVGTAGVISIPGEAVNVIPGAVDFVFEMRTDKPTDMDAVIETIRNMYSSGELEIERYHSQPPVQMDSELALAIERICDSEGIPFERMVSGAGHDAMNIAERIRSIMFFIPSLGGISHRIDEYSSPDDMYLGYRILRELVVSIDGGKLL